MNLEKLAREIAMCKSPNVDKWLVPIVNLEQMISLIQRQESELAASRDENEALKAARQPLADNFAAPSVTVDTLATFNWTRNGMEPSELPGAVYCYVDDALAHTARAVAAAVAVENQRHEVTIKENNEREQEAVDVCRALGLIPEEVDHHAVLSAISVMQANVVELCEKLTAQPVAGELPQRLADIQKGLHPNFWPVLAEAVEALKGHPVQQPAAVVGLPAPMHYGALHRADYVDGWNDCRAVISTAPVPAAGVQGDDGRDVLRECVNALRTAWHISSVVQTRNDIASVIKRAQAFIDNATAQPDSGRDAEQAFEDGKRLAHEQATAVTHALMAERDEWKAKAIAKDSGRDAALSKLLAEMVKLHEERGIVLTVHMNALRDYLAAHPANGAQAGDEPPSTIESLVGTWPGSVLAAAKKGGN